MNYSDPTALASRIHAALPQTQCKRCGYPDCAAYAYAIATGQAAINQCPPGGAEGVSRLAAITGQRAQDLNPSNGMETPRSVAVIDEAWCIGCTLCLPVCPTDAILGSNKMMHTVIEASCTGCELCIAVCPVDCIGLENVTGKLTGWAAWTQTQADEALTRYVFHRYLHTDSLIESSKSLPNAFPDSIPNSLVKSPVKAVKNSADADKKQSAIKAAMARSRALRLK